ncbi:hypothetical protein C8R46DRAFT_1229665 [Mycena filopes]|nr:hypothetical protein C8R46DRAFT_1229665 [Mycena filopes]
MKVLELPVELVFKVLRGLTLEDIMNITRSCHYFRAISLASPDVWVDSQDSVSLPPVEELASIEPSLVARYACRAISLHQKWKEPIITPLRSSRPSIGELPSWSLWIPPEMALGFNSPLWCELLPGAKTFFVGKRTAAGVYDVHGRYGVEFDLHGQVIDVGWDSRQPEGVSLMFGFLMNTFGEGRYIATVLCLYTLGGQATALTVSPPRYISLPDIPRAPKGLAVQDNTVLMWGNDFILLVNILSGKKWYLRPREEENLNILLATFQPSPRSRIVLLSEETDSTELRTRTLFVVHNITSSQVIGGRYDEWERGVLSLTQLETVPLPPRVRAARNESQFALYMDGASVGLIDVEVHSEAPMWGIQHPTASAVVQLHGSHIDHFWPCWTPSGPLFLFVLRGRRVEFWQYPAGPTDPPRCLDPIATEFVLSAGKPWMVLFTFDPSRGVLLLLANGRTLVLQY